MPSFQYNNVCYPDADSAFQAWKTQFPTLPDANGVIWNINTVSINTNTGLITGSIKKSTSGTQSLTAGAQLQPCSVYQNSVFDKLPLQDALFAGFMIFSFLIGVSFSRSRL